MTRTKLTDEERDYLTSLLAEVEGSVRAFCYHRHGNSRRDQFDDALQTAMVGVIDMMLANSWNRHRDQRHICGHVRELSRSWFRLRSHEVLFMGERFSIDDKHDFLVHEQQDDEQGEQSDDILQTLMTTIEELTPSKKVYMQHLVAVVNEGAVQVEDMHQGGIVKPLIESLARDGINRKPAGIQAGLRNARNELWERLREKGVVSGERPTIVRR